VPGGRTPRDQEVKIRPVLILRRHNVTTHASHGSHAHRPAHPAPAQHPLVGIWKLVSSQATITEHGKAEVFVAQKPKGYLIVTPWGRMMTISIGGERKKIPTSDADLIELWKTMMAYTGKYRVEGEYLITNVDVAWYEVWAGTEQKRQFKLEGDKLTILTTPQPIGAGRRAKAMVSHIVVWERDK